MMKKTATVYSAAPLRTRALSFFTRHKEMLAFIIVFCAPVVLYLHSVGFGFIGFDDRDVLTKNVAVLSDLKNIPKAFQKDAFLGKTSQFYRPLQTLSFMVDIAVSGGNHPWMYHLTNVILFGFIACTLFLILRKLLIPIGAAVIGVMLYCAHPLFVSSVCWIPGRGDWLLVLFSLLSFFFLIEYLNRHTPLSLFAHWFAFALALFSKETAAVLPLVFIAYYRAFSYHRRFQRGHLIAAGLYVLTGALWFWLRSAATKSLTGQPNVGVAILFANFRVYPESLTRLFFPIDNSFISSFSLSAAVIGLAFMALIAAAFFLPVGRSKKEKLFSLSWYVLLTLPALVIKEDFIDYLSHRLFLPLIGIFLFIMFSLPQKLLEGGKKHVRIITAGVCGCVLIALSSLTIIHSRSFSDPLTFWNSSIASHPNNILLYMNRGFEKFMRSDVDGAIEDFSKASSLKPDYALAYNNLGTAFSAKGDLDRAIREYDHAIALDPRYGEAYKNRGKAYAEKRNIDQALHDFEKAAAVNPHDASAYNEKANIFFDRGDYGQALKEYTKAIEADPSFADAYVNRGNVFSASGDIDSAIRDYRTAVEVNPYSADAYNNLGLAFFSKGDFRSAVLNFEKAVQLQPDAAEFYYHRGNAHSAQGDLEKAAADYQAAVARNPAHARAHNNLGLIYQARRDPERALSEFEKAIALNPRLPEAYYNRGNYFLMRGDPDRAMRDYDKALDLKHDYAEAFAVRGIARFRKGDIDAAVSDYRKAIAINPNDAHAYANLAEAYKAKGMTKEAEQSFLMYEKLTGRK